MASAPTNASIASPCGVIWLWEQASDPFGTGNNARGLGCQRLPLLELFYTLTLFCHNGIFVGVHLDVTINKPYQ